MKPKDSYELLLPIFEAMDKTIKVESVDDIGDGTYKVFTCNTLWLTLKREVTINSVVYTVKDLMPNEWVLFEGSSLPDVEEFEIYAPKPFRNTAKEQNILLALIDQEGLWTDKTPMIWVHTITREEIDKSLSSTIDRTADYDIFFLANYNPEDWLTEDHHRYVITPMRNLLDEFVNSLMLSKTTNTIDLKYEQFDHVKLSLQTDKKASPTNDLLSGTQFRGSVIFMRDYSCNC